MINDNASKTGSLNEKEEKTPEDLIVFIFNCLIFFNINNEQNNINNNKQNMSSPQKINLESFTQEEKILNYKLVPKILKIISDNFLEY